MNTDTKKTLLLVEDEALVAMAEKRQLEKYGYAVLAAETGEEAVESANGNPSIDLILMDINLGKGIDGTQAAEAILRGRDIPIVFLSSHSEPEIVEKTERITSYGYVVKNSSITVLDASIKMAFKLFESRRSVAKINAELKSHAQLLGKIIDTFPGFVIWKDSNSAFIGCNENFARLAGVSRPSELVGKRDSDLCFSQDEVNSFIADDRLVMETGKPMLHIEECEHLADGKNMYLDTSKYPLFGEDGRISRILVLATDITEKRQAELKMLFINKAIDSINVAIGISDGQGRHIYQNKALGDLFGYGSAEELEAAGGGATVVKSPEVAKEMFGNIQSGRSWSGELEMVTKGGRVFPAFEQADAIKDGAGNIIGLIGVITDISERRRIMGKLEESNEELKETQKVAHIGSWHLDIATDEITWSDELYRMYGLDPAEPPPRLLDSSHLFTVDSWDKLSSAIVKTAKGGIPYELELETLRKNGSHGWMWAHGNSVKDANGNIVGLRGAVQDITERKLAEERILALLGEKELILKEVHHRVKNNLNVLGSLLSLHAQTVEEQSARTALEEAKGRIQSMSLLYDKLYRSPDFTELSIKEFLSDMIDEIVANFPNSTMVKVEKDIQDFIVDAKRLQSLGIVINELLTNVMKHAFKGRENGSIAIFATVVDGTMAISVQDDGNGIPEHVSFENSNGFGLQLIQVLTRQLEGKIRVERGKGTKVVLELEANVR